MHLFNYDKISKDYHPLVALAIFFLWPLMFCMLGIVARLIGSKNSNLNQKVEGFLNKYMMQ